jgi:hypothetical protein
MSRAYLPNRYNGYVQNANHELDNKHPEYNDHVGRRSDRSEEADEMETLKLTKFTSIPKPIDYVVFIACHGMTVDKFTFGSRARYVATFPFETVLGSHLGMPVLRYNNHVVYDWMCTRYIPQIIDIIQMGGAYTGEAIFQNDGLFENIFTEGSPKKIRFSGETTADLNLFIPEPYAQHSSTLERNPDGIYVFNLDATTSVDTRCKDIAPEILTSVFNDRAHDGKTYIHRTDGEYAVAGVQTVKLSTLFHVLSLYFRKPEYAEKRIVIMLGSCRSVPDSFYRAIESGSSDSEGGGNTRRNRRTRTRKIRIRSVRSRRNRTSRRRRNHATNKK